MTSHPHKLRLLDLPTLAMHSGRVYPNQAVTLAALAGQSGRRLPLGGLITSVLRLRRGRQLWVSRDGSTLLGVAGLRRRAGSSAWEIDYLLNTTSNDAFLLDLLDRVVATAGADGAHRVFLRVPDESGILNLALQHGFMVVTRETLYEGAPRPEARTSPRARRRQRSDDHSLFQLYGHAVNQEVRWLTALAPSEWRATLEPLEDDSEEWILPNPGDEGAAAFIRLAHGRAGSSVSILSEERSAAAAVDIALRHGRTTRFRLLVAEYAIAQERAAQEAGLQATGRYALLVRPIAQRAHRLKLAEQAVEGSGRPVVQ